MKILDFGLAKQAPGRGAPDNRTQWATEPGMVLGTAGYMAPEQIRDQPVDGRADLFACGAVLYEMLAGLRAFQRDTPAETMTAILKDDPPELATPRRPAPGARAHRATRARKGPKRSFPVGAGSGVRPAVSRRIRRTPGRHGAAPVRGLQRREGVAWALVAALAIAAAARLWPGGRAATPTRIANLILSDEADMSASSRQPVGVLVSPDGSRIFAQSPRGDRRVFMRELDRPMSTTLPNTELGRVMFISPDGRWVGFSTTTTLKKVSLVDGSVVSICQTDTIPTTGAVSVDGQVVFSMGLALWIVAAEGGTPRPLTVLTEHEQAQEVGGFLPDGRTLLFTNWLADHPRIEALTLATGVRRVVMEQATGGQYVATGQLVFVRDGALLAAAFDVNRLETGAPVRVLDRIRTNTTGIPKLGISSDGSVLAYAEPERASLVWVTRTGLETPLDLPARQYQFVRVSGDGRRVAFADEASVWVADSVAKRQRTRLVRALRLRQHGLEPGQFPAFVFGSGTTW